MNRNASKSAKKHRDKQTNCRYCGQPFYDKCTRTFDHFYPIDKEGPNAKWNKFIVCHPCNHDKGNKMQAEFIQHLLKKIKNTKDQNTKYFIRASKTIVNMLLIEEQIWPLFEGRDIL